MVTYFYRHPLLFLLFPLFGVKMSVWNSKNSENSSPPCAENVCSED